MADERMNWAIAGQGAFLRRAQDAVERAKDVCERGALEVTETQYLEKQLDVAAGAIQEAMMALDLFVADLRDQVAKLRAATKRPEHVAEVPAAVGQAQPAAIDQADTPRPTKATKTKGG